MISRHRSILCSLSPQISSRQKAGGPRSRAGNEPITSAVAAWQGEVGDTRRFEVH
jgi:hypothetical protein